MRLQDWALLAASCVNAVAISWAGINAQAYVTATTFMVSSTVRTNVSQYLTYLVLDTACNVLSGAY